MIVMITSSCQTEVRKEYHENRCLDWKICKKESGYVIPHFYQMVKVTLQIKKSQ